MTADLHVVAPRKLQLNELLALEAATCAEDRLAGWSAHEIYTTACAERDAILANRYLDQSVRNFITAATKQADHRFENAATPNLIGADMAAERERARVDGIRTALVLLRWYRHLAAKIGSGFPGPTVRELGSYPALPPIRDKVAAQTVASKFSIELWCLERRDTLLNPSLVRVLDGARLALRADALPDSDRAVLRSWERSIAEWIDAAFIPVTLNDGMDDARYAVAHAG
jgi:hypothetical protein